MCLFYCMEIVWKFKQGTLTPHSRVQVLECPISEQNRFYSSFDPLQPFPGFQRKQRWHFGRAIDFLRALALRVRPGPIEKILPKLSQTMIPHNSIQSLRCCDLNQKNCK